MDFAILPPGLILICVSILLLVVPHTYRMALVVTAPLLTLLQIWSIRPDMALPSHLLGYDILPLTIHPFTRIFSTAFAFAALGGGVFGLGSKNRYETPLGFCSAGFAIALTFSGDWFSFFMNWELLAIASIFLIWGGGNIHSKKAGMRYALMHLAGGSLLLAGIAAQVSITQTALLPTFQLHQEEWIWTSSLFLDSDIYMDYLSNLSIQSVGIWMIFIGVLIHLGAPPFSAWVTDAYPESSPSGMVFLSAFTTKAAVFALLTLFAGNTILIWIGIFMAFYGMLYAILENDMRRILAFSIINQVGFMVVGAGIGTTLALQGAAAHAFCHIVYKALLVMSAGSVLQQTGIRRCSELGGLYHSMKFTTLCCLVGALSISAFPFTSGFVSKSLITESADPLIWILLLVASAGVFLHAGIKFPWFVFFQKDSGLRPEDPALSMRLAMGGFAIACVLPGIFPQTLLYSMLDIPVTLEVYTAHHIISQLEVLLFAGLGFFLCLPLLKRTLTITLTFDWLYRRPLLNLLKTLEKQVNKGYTAIRDLLSAAAQRGKIHLMRFSGQGGMFAEVNTLATTTLLLTLLLASYLLFHYNN